MGNWGFILWLIGLSIITFFAVAWLLDISNRQRQLQKRLEEIFTDAEGRDLADPLQALKERLDAHEYRAEQLYQEFGRLAANIPNSIQAIGLVRFQAFQDYGGDQSFALALANSDGDGAVLTGIFAREGTRVYAKPLTGWSSSYSLSFEEEEAISQAKGQIPGDAPAQADDS
jgi:hypothetical protein